MEKEDEGGGGGSDLFASLIKIQMTLFHRLGGLSPLYAITENAFFNV